jgi:hypothetical protein
MPEAYAHGLALALPEEVVPPALPSGWAATRIKYGVGAPDRIRARDARIIRIPIDGGDGVQIAGGAA